MQPARMARSFQTIFSPNHENLILLFHNGTDPGPGVVEASLGSCLAIPQVPSEQTGDYFLGKLFGVSTYPLSLAEWSVASGLYTKGSRTEPSESVIPVTDVSMREYRS